MELEKSVERQTKNTIEYYKNLDNLEEVPVDILRTMYKDLLQDNYKLDKENQKLFEININSIPKKKIEDKIKELEEKYNNSVNDVYKKPTEALIDFQRIVGAKEVLQELLDDK